jgi:hypothetical protein
MRHLISDRHVDRTPVVALALAIAGLAFAARADAPRVCFEPARACPGFRANDLSFPLMRQARERAEQRSAPFFAVILKTTKGCAVSPAEVESIQALFPDRKVFYPRFECEGDEQSNVSYSNVDTRQGFIAVYGGQGRGAANETLARVHATKRFPGANLRSMQVIYNSP